MTKPIPKGKPLRSGQEVSSRYLVTGWVGEGGMQDVYVATDRAFDRPVALKCPKSTAAEKRFSRSARISARINHPNVARTLDYLTVDEQSFLIEELIVGQDLKKLRDSMPVMDPYLAAHVTHHVAKGLAASHHAGVVHRDLKPSNILVPSGLDVASAKVTDFGIATMAEAELAHFDEETFTSSSTMAGALPYMSPEMLRGAKFGQKPADVWAMGAMLYEFFSGVKPFGKGFAAVEKITKAEIPPLPAMAAKAQFKGIAADLYEVVKQCLVKDPEQRLTADQLVQTMSSLCYPVSARVTGKVFEVKWGSQFFAKTRQGTVFFHAESVYGDPPAVGDEVCMAVYDGSPYSRAHPVSVLGK